MTTPLSRIKVFSRSLMQSGLPVWEADLRLAFTPKANKKEPPDPMRAHSVRVLAQRVETTPLIAGGKERQFHEPLLYQGLAYSPGDGNLVVEKFGGRAGMVVALADQKADATFVPREPPSKEDDATKLWMPGLVLESGSIPIGILSRDYTILGWRDNELWRSLLGLMPLKRDDTVPDLEISPIFTPASDINDEANEGREEFLRTRVVKARSKQEQPYVVAHLVPQGLAFQVTMRSPIDRKPLDLVLCLTTEPGSATGFRLIPLPSPDAAKLSAELKAEVGRILRGSPVEFDAPWDGVPPVYWKLKWDGSRRRLVADPQVYFEPSAVNAAFVSAVPPGAALSAVAGLRCREATLLWPNQVATLKLSGGESIVGDPLAAEARFSWNAPAPNPGGAPATTPPPSPFPLAVDVQLSGTSGEFEAIAQVEDLASFLACNYERAGLLARSDVEIMRRNHQKVLAPYAFLPLERGVLQLPLPVPRAQSAGTPPKSAFSGFIYANGPQLQHQLDITVAREFVATFDADRGEILFKGCVGTHTGALWACTETPSAAEVLPSLIAGALATQPVPVVFGNESVQGWRLRVGNLSTSSPTRVDFIELEALDTARKPAVIAWLPHTEAALIAVPALTRTRPAAHRPSGTRDLAPHVYEPASVSRHSPLRLVMPPGYSLPILEMPGAVIDLQHPLSKVLVREPDRDHEDTSGTNAISFAFMTLPGAELACVPLDKRMTSPFFRAQVSVRYDLPLLGDLFAAASVRQARGAAAAPPGSSQDDNGPPATSLYPAILADATSRAGDRASLNRTAEDRLVSWTAPEAQTSVSISNLVQPYTWSTKFELRWTEGTSRLPIGAFVLGKQGYAASSALAGISDTLYALNGTLHEDPRPNSIPIQLRGFSARLYSDPSRAEEVIDQAGYMRDRNTAPLLAGGVQAESRALSQRTAQGGSNWMTARVAKIDLRTGPSATAFLHTVDLPLVETKDGLEFDGASSPFESDAAAAGLALRHDRLAKSVYHWGFGSTDAGDPNSFSISLGPFRFRARRLWKLSLTHKPHVHSRVCIVGYLEPPGKRLTALTARVADDQAYANGSPIAIEFEGTPTKPLTLTSACSVNIDAAVMIEPKQPATVTWAASAQVTYGGHVLDTNREEFVLAFPLMISEGTTHPVVNATLQVRLFGQPLLLADGHMRFTDDGFSVRFKPPAQPKAEGSELRVREIRLEWDREGGACIDIRARLCISARRSDRGAEKAPLTLAHWKLGLTFAWLGLHAQQGTADRIHISHHHGSLSILARRSLPRDTDVLHGLAAAKASSVLLCAAACVQTEPESTLPWLPSRLGSGIAEFVVDGSGVSGPTMRHSLRPHPEGGVGDGWASTCQVTLRSLQRRSRIAWPLSALDFKSVPGSRGTLVTPRRSEHAAAHHVATATVIDAPLDIALIAREGRRFVLSEVWRLPAVPVQHEFVFAGVKRTWSSLDELLIADLPALARLARDEVENPAGATYAFAPRYRGDLAQTPDIVPRAGVLARAFARAGLPSWELIRALALQATTPPELVLIGSSVLDILTEKGTAATISKGVTLGMPWVASYRDGANIGALTSIPQSSVPDSGLLLSHYDAAAGRPREMNSTHVAALSVSNHTSLASILSRIEYLFNATDTATRKAAFGGVAPVEQAIASAPDPKDGSGWLERPVFWRTLVALETALAPAFDSVAFGERVRSVLVRYTPDKAPRADVLRVAVGRSDRDESAEPASVCGDLVVLDRNGVWPLELPRDRECLLAKGTVDPTLPQAGDTLRLAQLAYIVSKEPLAVLLMVRRSDADPAVLAQPLRFLTVLAKDGAPNASRPLRQRTALLPASPALGWPLTGETMGLRRTGLALQDQTPIQDARIAWSGEALALGMPAKAWSQLESAGDAVALVTLSQRVLFRRPGDGQVLAPPDRMEAPVSARPRVPTAASMVSALQTVTGQSPSGLAPLLPGPLEIVTTGRRPGVNIMQSQGLVFARGAPMNALRPREGRPASRGSMLWYEVRTARSTALPRIDRVGTGPIWNLDTARRTFVAFDCIEEVQENGAKIMRLRQFHLTHGPATLYRYDLTGAFRSVQIGASAYEVKPLTAANWRGVIELDVDVPGATSAAAAAQFLVQTGLLPADGSTKATAPQTADLCIGNRRFAFSAIAWSARNPSDTGLRLRLKMAPAAVPAAAEALAQMSADTPPFAQISSPPEQVGAAPPEGTDVSLGLLSDVLDALRVGPPRVLSVPIPAAPTNRPYLAIRTATLAFGDPAYDEELASKTASDSADISGQAYQLAADRREYDVTSAIHFRVGAVKAEPGSAVAWIASQPMNVQFAYVPALSKDDPAQSYPLKVVGKLPQPGSAAPVYTAQDQPYAVAVSDFEWIPPGKSLWEPAPLRGGDKIAISAWPASAGISAPEQGALTIRVTVVDEPVIAPPSSVYGLLTINGEKKQPTAALFASAPLAQRIEFPALSEDLAVGHVRRRALFLWPFVPRSSNQQAQLYVTLLKMDRTGGGQLPDTIEDFQVLGGLP